MRRVAILAIVMASGAASAAIAGQPPASANALAQAAFAPKPVQSSPASDSIGDFLDRNAYLPRPGDLPFSARSANDPHAEEIAVVRLWPRTMSFDQGAMSLDFAPHAGVSRSGGAAEAGATLEVSKAEAAGAKLKAMGVKDGATFGDKGRWYLFAAASGRAVGLNMMHGENGWDRAGWSTDTTSKLVGDTQVGIGWRKGAMQTSFGYVHRKVKGAHVMYGVDPHDDDLVAFTMSLKPRR